jgi:hypothetical protein
VCVCFTLFFCLFCSARNPTQGLKVAGQMFHHWAASPAQPNLFFIDILYWCHWFFFFFFFFLVRLGLNSKQALYNLNHNSSPVLRSFKKTVILKQTLYCKSDSGETTKTIQPLNGLKQSLFVFKFIYRVFLVSQGDVCFHRIFKRYVKCMYVVRSKSVLARLSGSRLKSQLHASRDRSVVVWDQPRQKAN